MLLELFVACFWQFSFLSQCDDFAKAIDFIWWRILAILQMLSFLKITCFLEVFFARNNSNVLVQFFSHNFNFCAKVKFLESLKPLHNGQFWSFRKCSHFSNSRCFLELFFCTQELECASRVVFRMFLTILIFDPKGWFCKGYSLYTGANFCHLRNVVIFRI